MKRERKGEITVGPYLILSYATMSKENRRLLSVDFLSLQILENTYPNWIPPLNLSIFRYFPKTFQKIPFQTHFPFLILTLQASY